ncbi:MAG: C4-dicarboxylate TRAP transporter substrate-binding protein [Propionivibrio sp.]|nr:C4-dicarboxylate TRAP transporter substrate-binding protein [Propionivibrio sp.]
MSKIFNTKLKNLVLAGALSLFASAVLAADYSIKVAYENNPGEPLDLAVQEWAKLFAKKTGGKGELKLFPSSQLGSKKDVTEQMKLGSGIITITDGGFLADYVPDFGILMGPYLANDYKDLFKLAKTPWYADLSEKLAAKGLRVLTTNWLYGTRHFLLKKPAKTPEELKGVKLRSPNNRIQIEAIQSMGATPTPMPLSEVYPALSTGVIDGTESPISVFYAMKAFEAAKYLVKTGYIHNISQWIIGEKYFKKLPADVQKALMESAEEAGDIMTNSVMKAEQEAVEKLKQAGVTIIEVDREAFKKAAMPTYKKFPEWTPSLYEKVQGYMK